MKIFKLHKPLCLNLLILVSAFAIVDPSLSSMTPCKSDSFCQQSFNDNYYCDPHTSRCNRQALLPSDSWVTIVGCVGVLLFNVLSYSLGVSSNAISFPALILFFAFTGKDTMAVLKTGNILASFINLIFVLGLRDPQNGNKLFVDFNLLIFITPMMLIGTMIGIVAFGILPAIFSYIFITVTLLYLTVRNAHRWVVNDMDKLKQEEVVDSLDSREQGSQPRRTKNSNLKLCMSDHLKSDMDSREFKWDPKDLINSTHNSLELVPNSKFLSERSLNKDSEATRSTRSLVQLRSQLHNTNVIECRLSDDRCNTIQHEKASKDMANTTAADLSRNMHLIPNSNSHWSDSDSDSDPRPSKDQRISRILQDSPEPWSVGPSENMDAKPLPNTLNSSAEVNSQSAMSLLFTEYKSLLLVGAIFSIMVFGNLIRGSSNRPSILRVFFSSTITNILYVLCIALLVFITYLIFSHIRDTQRDQTDSQLTQSPNYPPRLMIQIAVCAMIGGFISSIGVSGGLFIFSALILLDIRPLVIKATMGLLLFVIYLTHGFQFFYLGFFDLYNTCIMAAIAVTGCFIGNILIKRSLANNGSDKTNALLSALNFILTASICIGLPFVAYHEAQNNNSFFNFKSIW